MGVTWCTRPGGNAAHYFADGIDRPCECGQRPWFQAHHGAPRTPAATESPVDIESGTAYSYGLSPGREAPR